MNLCIFSGRVGRDPELRHTPGGDAVLSWPLAVDTGTKDKPATMWIDCRLWGKRGESISQYISKGNKLVVSGRLAQEDYTSKAGEAKTALRLSVDQVELESKPRDAAPPQVSQKPQRRQEDLSDDIPF